MSRAGNIYTDLALEFARAYPPPQKDLTTKEFDRWGIDRQEIDGIDDYDGISKTSPHWMKLLRQRNDLRRRLNAGASSEAYRETGEFPAFSIDVDKYGDSYLVRFTTDTYEILARTLPQTVYRAATTKRARIDRLRQSIDYDALPPNHQMMIEQLNRHVRLLMKDIERRVEDFDEEFAIAEEMIRKLELKPRNGGLIAFTTGDFDAPPLVE